MTNKLQQYLTIVIVLLVNILVFTSCAPFAERGYDGVVKWVPDGDTIELDNGKFIRYIGIDTPELHHPKRSITPEYFAEEAKEYNKKLVLGKRVRLEFDVDKEDKYKRLLAYVYVGETFVNARLIEEGYAKLYIFPPNTKYAEEFLELEQQAKKAKKGRWAE